MHGGVVLRNVTVRYGRLAALDAVSGAFEPGSLTAVVGANGAGKSTLLAAIAGAVRLTAGTIDRPGPGQMAHLPQLAAINAEYPLTIAEVIALGAWRDIGVFRAPSPLVQKQAAAAAEMVGLGDRLDRRVGELSVGELQRTLFARLIVQDASVILLDEPFAAVDARTASVLLDLVARWHAEGRTVIAVLHDLDVVRTRFPSTLVLARRCLAWGATAPSLPALAA